MNLFEPVAQTLPADCSVKLPQHDSIIKPYCLSHGTLECADLEFTRRFYEEFLGLECVQHAITAMAIRLGMRFDVVCVQVGADQIRPCNVLNHWGLDVDSRDAVDRAHAAALANQEKYGIRKILDVKDMHGVYSFYMQDVDHNWWEIEYYENGFVHDDYFDFGDRFGPRAGKAKS